MLDLPLNLSPSVIGRAAESSNVRTGDGSCGPARVQLALCSTILESAKLPSRARKRLSLQHRPLL